MAGMKFADLVLLISDVVKDHELRVEHNANGSWRMWIAITRKLGVSGEALEKLVKFCKKNEIHIGIFDQTIVFLGKD